MKKGIMMLAFVLSLVFFAQPASASTVPGAADTQGEIVAPTVGKLVSKKAGVLNVTFQGDPSFEYQIQYSMKKNFKKALTADVPKGESSFELTDLMPGKKYFVRMRGKNAEGVYGEWGASKKKKVKKGWTIVNVKAAAAIEADITLSGSGSGYHAKLVIGGGTVDAAVSFGIQYDQCAVAPYTGKAMALIENVASNAPGGQSYVRPGNKSLKLGKKYRMMVAIDKSGNGGVYLDNKKIGSFKNPALAKQNVYLRIEGCARKNGDSVNAVFENIKLRKGKKFDPNRKWAISGYGAYNKGLKIKEDKKTDTFTFSGTITGLPANGDWDNCYESVSALVQVQ